MKVKKKFDKIDIILLIILILIISLVILLFSYAKFYVDSINDTTTTTIDGNFDCLDVSMNETGVVSLNKNYPVTDNYALLNFTPITINMTNNCTTGDIPYGLSLANLYQTALDYDTSYIPASKIRIKVLKAIDDGAETTLIDTDFLSNVSIFATTSVAYKYTMTHYNSYEAYSLYSVKDLYNIDLNTISSNQSVIYKIYLWIDYYEGDPNRVGGEEYDNSTQGLKFASSVAVTLNVDNNS